ncbi:RNF213 [Branchiostoma lanceolatum]|uniref:RNF213 protein n=1 Tax=Branchiostoma lanceolatum TaxID=7740 RepID=A0A8J9W5Q3_BRALA|nr:RNF213 [Branchiostoma lanceolatum]
MRQLVYRVQPLPPSALPLVWDFGQLNIQTERLYIEQMVMRCLNEDHITADSTEVVAAVLTASQQFMRKKKDECSFVSLRDVERTLTVMDWFLQMLPVLSALMNKKIADQARTDTPETTNICRALILALGVCYQARLEERNDYRKVIAEHFNGDNFTLPKGAKTIEEEIEICQDVFLDQLETLLAPNIARNTALKENVFMMVVCIELRIPLFLVGKPGSSKSLAKSVVSDAMQGESAPSDFFKTMKQAHMMSFQCSPLATPESIVKTFHQCSMFQQDKDLTKFVSVVVLDEIGLAEDSPKMPLKTLHALLEEGYVAEVGDEGNTNPPQKKVAFVGISNWALDPAKMNRGIFLSRGVPDNDDLRKSARGICEQDERVLAQLETMLGSLVSAYTSLYRPQLEDREYFGLRDFYSLIKMVSSFCRASGHPPSRAQLEHAIKRNFSGRDDIDPLQKFRTVLETCADQSERPNDPDCSPLGLIRASLQSIHSDSEGRYLLILTKNYAALTILQQEMLDFGSTVIVFGSSFPKDQEYTKICRDINRIKVCMETGKTVVLLNLENLYESLYDALNQYYVEMGDQKYVDLGLGTHRVKCRVHKDFRLVVVAEKDIVYEKFPIPLINRLEKHFLSVSTVLTPAQAGIAQRLHEWSEAFVDVKDVDDVSNAGMNSYKPADAFIGYHEDLSATVVLRVCQDVNSKDDTWEEMVFERAKEILLQCATPDAVVRLQSSRLTRHAETMAQKYFHCQHHSSLADCLLHNIPREGRNGILAQVTTHGRLLSRNDLPHLAETLDIKEAAMQLLSLQQFDTEQQFSKRIRSFLEQKQTKDEGGVLFVQCDSSDINANLIACASYTAQAERAQIGNLRPSVVFVVQLPRNPKASFSGLGGGQWLCYHIDDVHPPNDQSPDVNIMLGKSISSLIEPRVGTLPDGSHTEDHLSVAALLRSSVQSAAARLIDPTVIKQRTVYRINLLLRLLGNRGKQSEGQLTFAEVLKARLALLVKEQEDSQLNKGANWLSQKAATSRAVRQAGTLRRSAWVHLLSVVSPLVAEIIALFDRNSNLDLLKTGEGWLHQFWLEIAANTKAVRLHYEDCLSPKKRAVRETVSVQTSGYGGQVFKCQLPFSWLIKELVDKLWQEAKAMTEYTSEQIEEVLRNTFDETELGRQLSKTTKSCRDPAEVVVAYIHDYVWMTHKITTGSEVEVKLICRAVEHEVLSMVRQKQETPLAPHFTDVAIDDGLRGCLSRFSQLIQYWPDNDQLSALENVCRDRPNIKLDVAALRFALEKLSQELLQLTTSNGQQQWGSKLQSICFLAGELFAAYSVNSSKQEPEGQIQHSILDCKCLLVRLQVVKLYFDYECRSDQAIPMKTVERLLKYLGDKPNFKTEPTMTKLESFLVSKNKREAYRVFAANTSICCGCKDELSQPVVLPCNHVCDKDCLEDWFRSGKRTCPNCTKPVPEDFHPEVSFESQKALEKYRVSRRRSNAFFMEVVSKFCFAYDEPPQQEVIGMLLGYIVRKEDATQAGTKGFSPFADEGVDRTPVIRSFLLQLLLRFKFGDVCAHLKTYFERAQRFAGSMKDAIEVCIMFVQCMENALTSKVDRLPDQQGCLIELAASQLDKAAKRYKEFPSSGNESIPPMLQLDTIASIRFGLSVASDVMHSQVNQSSEGVVSEHFRYMGRLFENVQTLFKDFEAVTRWPVLFIPKYLRGRHGLDTLLSIGQSQETQWFLPDEMRGNQEEVVQDRFVVCGEAYHCIREATSNAILTRDIKQLVNTLQEPDIPQRDKETLTPLAIYTEVTLARVSAKQNPNAIHQAQQILEQFSRSTDAIRNKELIERLIMNNNDGLCTRLAFEPDQPPRQRSVSALLIHVGAVLATCPKNALLEPLKALDGAPHTVMKHYLPTMPEDPLPELREAFQKQEVGWYGKCCG